MTYFYSAYRIFTRPILTSGSAALALLALAACGGSSTMSGSGGTTAAPPAPLTIGTLPTGTTLSFTSGAGLETFGLYTNGGGFTASPQGGMTLTAAGFDFTIGSPGGSRTFSFSNAPIGSYGSVGIAHYRSCGIAQPFCGMLPDTLDVFFTGGAPSTLNYSTYGIWTQTPTFFAPSSVGVFATGLPTAVGDRPTTGSATYNGGAAGFIAIAAPTDSHFITHTFTANITLTADFAANTIGGALTNLATVKLEGQSLPSFGAAGIANSIALTGGTISGGNFAGAAAAMAATAATTVDISGTTGKFGGAFYGPKAAEAAGSLSMSSPTGTNVLASFGAAK